MSSAVRVEAMLAGGRLKTLVFITFNVSAGNRKQHRFLFAYTQKQFGLGQGTSKHLR